MARYALSWNGGEAFGRFTNNQVLEKARDLRDRRGTFRVYRAGEKEPCMVYRFLGTPVEFPAEPHQLDRYGRVPTSGKPRTKYLEARRLWAVNWRGEPITEI
jgi:hypothetical protein